MLKKTVSSVMTLKNGLTAKIFCLNDARARTIANANNKMPEDYHIDPRDYKWFYLVMVNIKGKSIGLVYFNVQKSRLAAIHNLKTRLEKEFSKTVNDVWFVTYENTVYLTDEKIAGLLIKAVKTAVPPQILAVLS